MIFSRKLVFFLSACLFLVYGCAGFIPSPVLTTGTANNGKSYPIECENLQSEIKKWIGTPYNYGGQSIKGADCSGFVQAVFRKLNQRLPRTVSEMRKTGKSVSVREIVCGDLIFFRMKGRGVDHVGIALNNYQFAHASVSKGVIINSYSQKYYRDRIAEVRRVIN